jgi:hypothetical protein
MRLGELTAAQRTEHATHCTADRLAITQHAERSTSHVADTGANTTRAAGTLGLDVAGDAAQQGEDEYGQDERFHGSPFGVGKHRNKQRLAVAAEQDRRFAADCSAAKLPVAQHVGLMSW